MNEKLILTAMHYRSLGYSVVPVRATKESVGHWAVFKKRIMTEEEIRQTFRWSSTKGIAIVTGNVSGNLEILDIDAKNDECGNLFNRFSSQVNQELPNFLSSAPIAQTRNLGYHIYYRCHSPGIAAILARRPEKDPVKFATGSQVLVLIEVLANGLYALAEPSPGYRFIQGSLDVVPVISFHEREILFKVARRFNEWNEVSKVIPCPRIYLPYHHQCISPLFDYDRRGDVIQLLKDHGWLVYKETTLRTSLRRPGKTDKKSSGNFHHVLNFFKVFTPNSVFKQGKGYRPSAVYAELECGGDFSVAVKQLLDLGFGTPYRKIIS